MGTPYFGAIKQKNMPIDYKKYCKTNLDYNENKEGCFGLALYWSCFIYGLVYFGAIIYVDGCWVAKMAHLGALESV